MNRVIVSAAFLLMVINPSVLAFKVTLIFLLFPLLAIRQKRPISSWIWLLIGLQFSALLYSVVQGLDEILLSPIQAPLDEFKNHKRYDFSSYLPSYQSFAMQGLSFILAAQTLVLGYRYLVSQREKLDTVLPPILSMILWINAGFWYLQYGEDLIFRGTGLFNEPGTYVCFVFPVLAMHLYLCKKVQVVQLLAILTFFLSFSVFGWVLGIIALILLCLSSLKASILLGATAFVAALSQYEKIYFYLDGRLVEGFSGYSVQAKLVPLLFWWAQDFSRQLLGGWTVNDCHCLYYDSGLWFSLIYDYGVLAGFFLLFLIRRAIKDLRLLICLVGFLLTKLVMVQPVAIIFVLFLLLYKKPKTDSAQISGDHSVAVS
jgi:hypothetical protein